MRRLIWGFAGRTNHIVGNLMYWLIISFLISQPKSIMGTLKNHLNSSPKKDLNGTQKNHLNEMVLLSSQNKN